MALYFYFTHVLLNFLIYFVSVILKMRSPVEEKFSTFFEKWMCQLEEYLPLLLSVSRNKQSHDQSGLEALVNKLTALHKDYYTAKWASAHEDVLPFYAPVWLSPLENALLWNTGWKPSMIFRLLDSVRKAQLPSASLVDMSEEQMKKIEGLNARIRMEEEKVNREMERQQVAMADRRMVELARLVSRIRTSEHPAAARVDGLVEAALREMIAGLERVMKMADCVRLKTLKGVLDVLNPIQSIDLLAALSILQIQMRTWGKRRQQRCTTVNICTKS